VLEEHNNACKWRSCRTGVDIVVLLQVRCCCIINKPTRWAQAQKSSICECTHRPNSCSCAFTATASLRLFLVTATLPHPGSFAGRCVPRGQFNCLEHEFKPVLLSSMVRSGYERTTLQWVRSVVAAEREQAACTLASCISNVLLWQRSDMYTKHTGDDTLECDGVLFNCCETRLVRTPTICETS
jgi:hypothetical protein